MTKFLDFSNLKAFANKKTNVIQMLKFGTSFLPLPTMFSVAIFLMVMESWDCVVMVKRVNNMKQYGKMRVASIFSFQPYLFKSIYLNYHGNYSHFGEVKNQIIRLKT